MYCSNCGQQIAAEDRFCRFCGTAQNAVPTPKNGSHWVPVVAMLLLCIIGIVLFFVIPFGDDPAAAVSGESGCFTIQDGALSFHSANYTGGSELLVPDTVNGQKVTSLSEGCFKNCKKLTSIVLPNTLETIGADAFRGCTALRGIRIPDSVRHIGADAFHGCTALEAVALSDSVTFVGPGAFGECNQLYYILFSGAHQDWVELYDEFITPYTGVFCDEGSFYQGKPSE